jgi:adhesin transport system outer membrane protein
LLCIFALISVLPLYSNAKDPEFGLGGQSQVFFQDPTYLHLLWKKVVHEHPQVLIQQQNLKSAGFDLQVSKQAFYPTPSISVERAQSNGGNDPSYAGTPQVATLRVQQPLWTGGRLTAQKNKATANRDIEFAKLLEIQQSLALKTVQAWSEIVSAQKQQSVLNKTKIELEFLQRKIERRADQGMSTQSEVKLSKLRVSMVQQQLNQTKMQEDLAWVKLKQWVPEALSLSAPTLENPGPWSDPYAHMQNLNNIDWEVLSAGQSPSALRLESQLRVQAAEIQEKRAAYQPDIYLRAEHQRGNFAYTSPTNVNRVFIGMTATTGAGFSLQQQLSALKAKHDSAQFEIALTQRLLSESVQSDVFNLIARQSKTEELKLNLESLEEIQSAWLRQFDSGRKTWIEVMNATQETMQNQLAGVENDTSMTLSYWRLQILAYGVSRWAHP